jgi:hypothetical protein
MAPLHKYYEFSGASFICEIRIHVSKSTPRLTRTQVENKIVSTSSSPISQAIVCLTATTNMASSIFSCAVKVLEHCELAVVSLLHEATAIYRAVVSKRLSSVRCTLSFDYSSILGEEEAGNCDRKPKPKYNLYFMLLGGRNGGGRILLSPNIN